MREPMLARGWTPRAAGWFTRSVGQGQLGVVSVGVASKHATPGTATATAYVHFRDDEIEAEVERLCGWQGRGYQTTTATTSIGYLMPDPRWQEWFVEPESVASVGDEIADAVRTYAQPHLAMLAEDPHLLLASIQSSPAYATAPGLARAALLLSRLGGNADAGELVGQRLALVGARVDAAAVEERRVADLLRGWLGT